MKRASSLVMLLIALVIAPAAAQPLPTDPRLTMGALDNGMGYIVRKHDNPPGRAHLWLHISTGSLNETDRQRGVAHFLEHMAFNGSPNFPPGSVIKYFESMGLTFGQHQNARTDFDTTTYQLFLPDNKPETLKKGLLFLSDVALRLTLPEAEIESERPVILEERRSRLSGNQRVQDYWIQHLAPGSLVGERIPIGTEDTIKGFTRQDLVDYYTKWYTPSNMTVMVVADMDESSIVGALKEAFSGGAKGPAPKDQEAGVKPYEKVNAIVASDAEITNARVEMIWLAQPEPPTTTVEQMRGDMIDRMAGWIFGRRIEDRVSKGKAAMQEGGALASDLFRSARIAEVLATGEPTKWKAILADLAQEVQRARVHGFSEREVDDARREIRSQLEQAVKTEPTMAADRMLAMWDGAIAAGVPITSAQQDLDIISKLLPTITPADINKRFNELFDTTAPLMFSVQLPSNAEVPTEEQLIDLGMQALKAIPENEAAAERPAVFMDKPPEAGKVVEESEHAGAAVTSAWLSNNARVHYRFMDYEKNQVLVNIMVAGGEIKETAANRGITQAGAAALLSESAATSALSSTNIRDLLTGRNVSVSGRPAPDAILLTISGSPEDLENGLQLAHLLLTDARVEKPALDIWKDQVRRIAEMRKTDVQVALGDLAAKMLYPKDEPRLGRLEPEQANRHSPESATAWIRDVLATGPIEVAVVGDLKKERAMELVLRYIGSLPERPKVSDSLFADLRKLSRPKGPIAAETKIHTATKKAAVMRGFFGVDAKNLRDVRLMNLAAQILSSRATQEVREKLGMTYAPQVQSSPAVEYPGFGFVALATPTDPAKAGSLRLAIGALYDAFAKDGPTADEMDTVKKQIANVLDEQMRRPLFWMTRLTTLDFRGNSLDDILGAAKAYQSFTADDVREAFNRYYKPESRFDFSVSPAPAAEAPK